MSLYGYLLEFEQPEILVQATDRAYHYGFRKMEAYSPFPIEELPEALRYKKNRVPLLVLCGGICGAVGAYLLQYYVSVIAYPIDVGGRPVHSWPAFVPVTFELCILGAGLSAVIGMLWLNGLPQPYHPIFNAQKFQLATRNRFFLCIEVSDPLSKKNESIDFLKSLGELSFTEVEA